MKSLRLNHVVKTAASTVGVGSEELNKVILGAETNNKVYKKAIEMKMEGLERSEASLGSFEDPNWAYKEAFILGMKSAYREILDLMVYTEVDK